MVGCRRHRMTHHPRRVPGKHHIKKDADDAASCRCAIRAELVGPLGRPTRGNRSAHRAVRCRLGQVVQCLHIRLKCCEDRRDPKPADFMMLCLWRSHCQSASSQIFQSVRVSWTGSVVTRMPPSRFRAITATDDCADTRPDSAAAFPVERTARRRCVCWPKRSPQARS